jgi:hypothetical protein
MIIGTQYASERTLNIDSDLDWWWSRKTLLAEYGTESGRIANIKVIGIFYTFPESINTPSYDQRFKNYGLCKLGGLLISVWTEGSNSSTSEFGLKEARPKEILSTRVIRNSINSLKRVITQNFDTERMKQKGLRLKGFLRYDFEL